MHLLASVSPELEHNTQLIGSVVDGMRSIGCLLQQPSYILAYASPLSFTGERGRPPVTIPHKRMEYLIDHEFSTTEIADLQASVHTVRRRKSDYGLSIQATYSALTNNELDALVESIHRDFPNYGYCMMQGHLQSVSHRVQQCRVRDSMIRTDPSGILRRCTSTVE